MEMPELEKRIKGALLSKTDEIIPADETFTRILEGLEKKQKRRILNMSYTHCIIAFICAVSVIFGATIILSVNEKASAREIINTVTTVIVLDKSKKVDEINNDESIIHTVNNDAKQGIADTSKIVGNIFFLQTFTSCFLLSQLNDLELYLKLMIIGKLTLAQNWYDDRFWHGLVPA
ncbi:hypothetical protein [Desulfosporosinus sp. BG]|uniref:hypothetical protein n=1 Tax=Desulfosporosinus sp. BG TaxID=1633135 RepID=UPI00083B0E5C|nr:hypothetical protein [Desulfosporosinus sp. BG]ODA39794.1 hypothetical protein DSBG_3400 [Desulfosporosinus sp. BG]